MNEHEEKTISSFIIPERRHRYRYILDSPKKRSKELDRLNHCADLNPKVTQWLASNNDVLSLLKKEGCPEKVYLISDDDKLDGKTMAIEDAIEELYAGDWGTIISCIPGKLAFYYDECGVRMALLKKI